MQGIWDRIQTANSKCSISSASSELQWEKGGEGRGREARNGWLERQTRNRKIDKIWKVD